MRLVVVVNHGNEIGPGSHVMGKVTDPGVMGRVVSDGGQQPVDPQRGSVSGSSQLGGGVIVEVGRGQEFIQRLTTVGDDIDGPFTGGVGQPHFGVSGNFVDQVVLTNAIRSARCGEQGQAGSPDRKKTTQCVCEQLLGRTG